LNLAYYENFKEGDNAGKSPNLIYAVYKLESLWKK